MGICTAHGCDGAHEGWRMATWTAAAPANSWSPDHSVGPRSCGSQITVTVTCRLSHSLNKTQTHLIRSWLAWPCLCAGAQHTHLDHKHACAHIHTSRPHCTCMHIRPWDGGDMNSCWDGSTLFPRTQRGGKGRRRPSVALGPGSGADKLLSVLDLRTEHSGS
jgi:hypothetical protein